MTLDHKTPGDSLSEVKPDLIVEPLPATIEGPNGPIPVIGRDMRGHLIIQLNATTGYKLPPGYSFTTDGLD